MAVDVGAITKAREKERHEARNSSHNAVVALELRYIADALEAIRGEFVGLVHLTGRMSGSQK